MTVRSHSFQSFQFRLSGETAKEVPQDAEQSSFENLRVKTCAALDSDAGSSAPALVV